MLNEQNHIKELYSLKHINDNQININYENKLITKILSNVVFKNPFMSEYLYKLEQLFILSLESNLIVKNWFNYTKDKYDN